MAACFKCGGSPNNKKKPVAFLYECTSCFTQVCNNHLKVSFGKNCPKCGAPVKLIESKAKGSSGGVSGGVSSGSGAGEAGIASTMVRQERAKGAFNAPGSEGGDVTSVSNIKVSVSQTFNQLLGNEKLPSSESGVTADLKAKLADESDSSKAAANKNSGSTTSSLGELIVEECDSDKDSSPAEPQALIEKLKDRVENKEMADAPVVLDCLFHVTSDQGLKSASQGLNCGGHFNVNEVVAYGSVISCSYLNEKIYTDFTKELAEHETLLGALAFTAQDVVNSDVEAQVITDNLPSIFEQTPKLCAVGPVELNFNQYSNYNKQLSVFKDVCSFAVSNNLPIFVVNNGADEQFLNLAEQMSGYNKVVISGVKAGVNVWKYALANGWYASVSPSASYVDDESLNHYRAFLKHVASDRLLIISGAESQAPQPNRGQWNSPAQATHTLEFLSKMREEKLEKLALQVNKNVVELF